MRFSNLAIWKQALTFHVATWRALLPLLPLALLPLVGDVLHAVLIRQRTRQQSLSAGPAVRETFAAVPPVLAMKFSFELAAFLWAFLPIYGWFKSIRHRLYWAMASNVVVFEGLTGRAGRRRCRELVESLPQGTGIRTLVTIPSILVAGFLLALAIGIEVFDTPYVFWICLLAIVWITLPWSAAVNTLFYLELSGPPANPPRPGQR